MPPGAVGPEINISEEIGNAGQRKNAKTSQLQPEFKIKVKNGLFTPTCFHCEPPELITYQTTLFYTQNQK